LSKTATALSESLANPSRLHGWHVQGLFEAVVVTLGSVRLLKVEDCGRFYSDGDAAVMLPDFRIVTNIGEQILVEVKSVAPAAEITDQSLRSTDVEKQMRYAEMTGARLLFAHYWAGLNLWTLVDANVLQSCGKKRVLSFKDAAMANEFVSLGDMSIGVEPPLVFSLLPNPSKPRLRESFSNTSDRIKFTIGGVELSNAGRVLTDKTERKIAWFLMRYGPWGVSEEPQVNDRGEVERFDYVFAPPGEDRTEQGLAVAGSLSSMYSVFYNFLTLSDEGVKKLRHEPDPGSLANFIPTDYWTQPSRALPIWAFKLAPSVGPLARKEKLDNFRA